MSSKKIFLFISLVVLTIFVKMIPASEDFRRDEDYIDKDDQDQGADNPDEFNKDHVSWKQINQLNEKYEKEIKHYCEKNNIEISENPEDKTCIVLYFKDLYDTFLRYYGYPDVGSNTYIHYLITKTEPNIETQADVDAFALTIDLETEYTNATFCPLPSEIKKTYTVNQFRFLYVLRNSIASVYGGEKPLTPKEFVEKSIYTPKDTRSVKRPTKFEMFNLKWTLKDFGAEDYYKLLTILDNVTKDKFDEKNEVYVAFLNNFEESMDIYYDTVTAMGINVLDSDQKAFYHKRMLLGLSSIYRTYRGESEVTLLEFTELMNGVANEIVEAKKTKTKPKVLKYEQPKTAKETDLIEIIAIPYLCASPTYAFTADPELPDNVNFRDVLHYVIAKFRR